jgi:prevent-host-death family protein
MPMVKMEATKARNEFSELLSTVKYGSGRVVIERRGKEVAALISVEDLHLLEMIEDEIDLEAARKALASPKNKVRVPLEAVKKRLGA